MLIKGLQKTTLIDYPGKIACTIFLFGCNFRCGYCHNPELVTTPEDFSYSENQGFSDYLKNYLDNKKISLTCAHKADQKYIIVSAASIIAKTTRDFEIEKIKEKIGIDFNSGYPSDKKTQEFLKKYHNKFPEIFRKSWVSYKNIKKAKQKSLAEF